MFPQFLKKQDKIAIVSPSGNIEEKYIDEAVKILADWGFEAEVGEFARGQVGRYSGTVEQRVSDFQAAIDNPEIKAILCARGGYGLMQIIDLIDFSDFEINPKWIIGYSDITVLHAAASNFDVVSLHAGMARHLTELPADSLILKSFHDVLFGELPSYTVPAHPLNRKGKAHGEVIGGNLSVLYGLRGTHFDMDGYKKILFIEDIGEKPYQIDRMIQNFKMGNIFESIDGLIVGQFTDYEEDPLMGKTVYELIADAVAEYDYPVCFNFPVGHVDNNVPLLIGAEAKFVVGDEVVLKY
jgi:muramoyltetrapeptide carboxypeptidase